MDWILAERDAASSMMMEKSPARNSVDGSPKWLLNLFNA